MTSICVNCGKPLPGNALFCPNCGSKAESALADEPVQPVYETPDITVYDAPTDHESQPLYSYSEDYRLNDDSTDESNMSETQTPSEETTGYRDTPVIIGEHVRENKAVKDYAHAKQSIPEPGPSVLITILKTALTVLLCIICFSLVISLVTLVVLRPENIPSVVGNSGVNQVLLDTGIMEEVVKGVNTSPEIDIVVDTDSLNDLLKRNNVSNEIGKVAEKYISAIAEGDFSYYLSSREIVSFLRAIAPDIEEELNYNLTKADYDLITELINEYADLKQYRVSTILDESGITTAVPYFVFSYRLLVVIAVIIALLIFDIILLYRKKLRSAFVSLGTLFAAAGIVIIAVSLFSGPLSGLFNRTAYYSYINLAAGVGKLLILPGTAVLVVGLLLIAVFFLIRKLRKSPSSNRTEKSVNGNGNRSWRLTGLITNVSVLLILAAFSLYSYQNIP